MEACSVTLRNGQTTRLENVFIRGSKIRFLILPDMLKNAPMFTNMTAGARGRGSAGSGKSAILRAQGKFFKIYLFIYILIIFNLQSLK